MRKDHYSYIVFVVFRTCTVFLVTIFSGEKTVVFTVVFTDVFTDVSSDVFSDVFLDLRNSYSGDEHMCSEHYCVDLDFENHPK